MEPKPNPEELIKVNINKVLIADDAAFIRFMLKDFVKAAGFEVAWEASTAQEAVALFKENLPGLTLLDVDMPDGEGLEALEQMKEYSPFSYVALLESPGSRKVCERYGPESERWVLYKPFQADTVIKFVKDLLTPGWDLK